MERTSKLRDLLKTKVEKEFQWRYRCAQSDYTDLNFAEAGGATIRRVVIDGQPALLDRGAGCRMGAAGFAAAVKR